MLRFGKSPMVTKWEWKEEDLQKCPLCGMGHPIYINGLVKAYISGETVPHPELGYSFCNCKNVWYTDWNNIRQSTYNDNYAHKYTHDKFKENAKTFAKTRVKQVNDSKDNINTFLDVGCGNTFLLDAIKEEYGWETIGFDINTELKSDTHKIIYGDIEKDIDLLPIVDVIWCHHVLEHTKDPVKVAELLKDKLVDNGILCISMPDTHFIDFNDPIRWGHWWVREHHIFWSFEEFCTEMIGLGFKILYTGRHAANGDYSLIMQK